MLTLDELKEKILEEGYDECLICDILEISVEELLEAFDYKLILNREKFDDDGV
jgi:hypothetical protein